MQDNHKDDGFLINKAMMIRKNENKIEDVYKISKKPIGTGAFGVVHTCVHKLTKQVLFNLQNTFHPHRTMRTNRTIIFESSSLVCGKLNDLRRW